MASPDECRGAAEARRRLIRRERAALAAGGLALLVVLGWLVAGGGDTPSGSRSAASRAEAGSRAKASRSEPSPGVDKVLGYTDYVERGSARRREVALTFDDGPSPYTPKVLKILRRLRASATFFPVGRSIVLFGRELQRVRRRGFPVGDHTVAHPLMGHLPRARQAGEIDGQARLLRRAGLPQPRLFRPPDGSFDAATRALLRHRRMLMVLWSVNPADYFRPGARNIVSRVLGAARPGAIVLLHDGGGDRSQTAAALPAIIRGLRARHLRPVTVPTLLRDAPPPQHQGPPPNFAGV